MKEWGWRIVTAIVATLVAYYTAQGATQNNITRIETKNDERYSAIVQRLDEMKQDGKDMRTDMNGIRREILDVLNRRPTR